LWRVIMKTVLFVHGTGVRDKDYRSSLEKIRDGLGELQISSLKIEGCLWGDPLGTKLNAGGKSIPTYARRGGRGMLTKQDLEIELWMHLYSDPLYELRIPALGPPENAAVVPGTLGDSERLDKFVRNLGISPDLRTLLDKAEISKTIENACSSLISSLPYREMLKTVTEPLGNFQDALARAIVAEAMALYLTKRKRDPAIHTDADLRDEVVKLVRNELGPYQAAIREWPGKILFGTGKAMVGVGMTAIGTPLMKWRRGALTDGASPVAGDILLYQSRGERIEDLIRVRIKEVQPPVVVIGHSLGGIALVDLLIHEDMHELVKLLITVGSQAPYFYEINALRSLEYKKTLPLHFPPWVNVYDLRDFLSYSAEKVFPGRATDYEVNNKQPFPESHSAYWNNRATYEIIARAIGEHVA
jgi:hypothetical protein